ncbi:MAG: hypothetical protein KGV59_06995 [Tenacibaculum sp.]|nr:hypothetical protein [Tenacibaculum sp.]
MYNRPSIDITKSKQTGKLVLKEMFLFKFLVNILYLILVVLPPYLCLVGIEHDSNKEISFIFLFLSLILSGFIIYSVYHLYSLKRIKGLSKKDNINLIKEIAKKIIGKLNYQTNE